MKKIVLLSFLLQVSFGVFSQSVSINPDNLQLPRVSALPACAAADYGKVVFLTTTNRANVCSGSGWVEIATGGGGGGSLTLPYNGSGSFSAAGLTVFNTGGGINSAGIQGMTGSAIGGANGVLGNAFEVAPTGNTVGVRGENVSTNTFGYGVFGSHAGGGSGVYGTTVTGFGVAGAASGAGGTGVYGTTTQAGTIGIFGLVNTGTSHGIYGKSTNSTSNAGFFENSTSTGFALQTIGRLRLQGNNAGAGRVLMSADGNGTALWSNITRTDVLKLGPAAFTSHISSNDVTHGARGVSFNTSAGSLHANISLPNGAAITGCTIHYIDNDGTASNVGLGLTSFAFQKMSQSSINSYTNIASGSFTNTSANSNTLSISPTVTETIDNANFYYRLVISMPASPNIIFVGATINYQYNL